jgi:acyl-CoA reductase-like NAD-dependent aldehyde dehydrogenase
MASTTLKVTSPIDGSIYAERKLASWDEFSAILSRAKAAEAGWAATPLDARLALLRRFTEALLVEKDAIGVELAWQMGRPVRYGPREVATACERSTAMIDFASEALRDYTPPAKEGFHRFVRRVPLGTVLVVPAWNYPFLIAVNSIIPALAAGNVVVLKHSSQTPLVGERFQQAFDKAGFPAGVFQNVHAGHAETERAVADARTDFVAFTGSVKGGHAMVHAANERFIDIGLELGGKDPAYVRADADVAYAIENLVDGSFFNSGQSCCGIERIYVHESVYDAFVEGAVALTKKYTLGSPLDAATDLGPMARASAARTVREEIAKAVAQGAKAHVDESLFPLSREGTAYLAPQILTNVTHEMSVMTEETFGPVVGIMKVANDDEAVRLMNDSPYGLTASVWTKDEARAVEIGARLETGTVFMNRCDYLDPALAWVGVKDSGRGVTLSPLGYEHLTRPKSFHLRVKT